MKKGVVKKRDVSYFSNIKKVPLNSSTSKAHLNSSKSFIKDRNTVSKVSLKDITDNLDYN